MPGFNEVSQFSTTILLKYEINDEVVSEIFSKFERGDFWNYLLWLAVARSRWAIHKCMWFFFNLSINNMPTDICWSWIVMISSHSFSTYAKFSEKTNVSYSLIRIRTCVYQELRNVSFPENLAYAINKWPFFLIDNTFRMKVLITSSS